MNHLQRVKKGSIDIASIVKGLQTVLASWRDALNDRRSVKGRLYTWAAFRSPMNVCAGSKQTSFQVDIVTSKGVDVVVSIDGVSDRAWRLRFGICRFTRTKTPEREMSHACRVQR